MAKAKYDWKITVKKAGIVLVEVLIAGALAYVMERPELMLLAPCIEAVRNWWKNKNL
jgi:hypothetical protein